MKKYDPELWSRSFCVHAVKYFYGQSNLRDAEKILGKMTQAELDNLYTLISEFNNDKFLERF